MLCTPNTLLCVTHFSAASKTPNVIIQDYDVPPLDTSFYNASYVLSDRIPSGRSFKKPHSPPFSPKTTYLQLPAYPSSPYHLSFALPSPVSTPGLTDSESEETCLEADIPVLTYQLYPCYPEYSFLPHRDQSFHIHQAFQSLELNLTNNMNSSQFLLQPFGSPGPASRPAFKFMIKFRYNKAADKHKEVAVSSSSIRKCHSKFVKVTSPYSVLSRFNIDQYPKSKIIEKQVTRGRKAPLSRVAKTPEDIMNRQHECKVCGGRFGRLEHLKRHFRSIHTEEKPYTCQLCHKGFSRSDNLVQHVKVHEEVENSS
ncbi:hypothetical protein BABINDRAFT_161903 [Babjeviella inositovora NRRL Y-12698]|uniref:C2H2-type domain-containing protein n=1 Tax=Babjeviella inositovora NRRL Y-12698 TaxID=984486 RepID=A0A1E3QPC8_9ASCO|nr:uncharacterized protein BABINDRAFT_161903 [Babjeviella inositovora NRRL Y-12698]ODQ79510.1 hypothetical protein BABINDRAFT_161903 [Babjeviella inositovora NRRL Y-12698]